jgi:dTDP-4-amino-4,6-dideoxygalactose transaminase
MARPTRGAGLVTVQLVHDPLPSRAGSVGALDTGVRFVDLAEQTRQLEPALTAAWHAVLDRGDFVLGEAVDNLEREYAAYCGVAHAVGVDSGFSALELSLRAAGCGPGDEVITQANTFVATASAILSCGARPVLVDCDEQGAMDPDAVSAAISPRTRAIIPVHLFGRIADMDPLLQLAERHGLVVIEDACQAHGALYKGRRAGSFGVAAAFSFYPAKNLGAFGDGGMLVTRSADLAAEARSVRHYGQRSKYVHERTPLNRRLDTLQAAVLSVKLPHLDGWNHRRQLLAEAYRERLDGFPIGLPPVEAPGRHVYHLFVIQVEERDALREALTAASIETGIHYPIPVHLNPAMHDLGYRAGAFPHAERLAARSLSLPIYPELPIAHVDRVAVAIGRFFAG